LDKLDANLCVRNRKLFSCAEGKRADAFQKAPKWPSTNANAKHHTKRGRTLGLFWNDFFSSAGGRDAVKWNCSVEMRAKTTDFSFCLRPVFHAAAGRISSSFRGVTQVAVCSKLPPAPGPNSSSCHRVAVACSPATASVPPDHRSPRSSLSPAAAFAHSQPGTSR
jgi:hypothetical protein